ncbi:MAG: 3-dehydroquinate synthase [Clostridia bacterium]|nr:3-dehydroquinate synthase [Clostridia bacterium]
MTTITVSASNTYQVKIAPGLLSSAGEELLALNGKKTCRVCIISDDTVFSLYGKTVTDALERAGFSVFSHVIAHGESSKCLSVYGEILEHLASEHLSRSDWLIALGGGVVGDLCGFCAATYLRGVKYMQIPTTLLAMVDSSVGGKTAIDLAAGKNLCGAFYPPHAVLCDITALNTLPDDIFADGMAEVIKYGFIFDRDLLTLLARDKTAFDRESVIARCIDHKRRVVEEDEFDRGVRQLLNFGHTAAHGIEQHSDYTISHGHAVAAGMGIVTRAAEAAGLIREPFSPMLEELLSAFDLPYDTDFTSAAMADAILSDKKRDGGIIRLVVSDEPGHAILYPCPADSCEAFLARGIRGGSR